MWGSLAYATEPPDLLRLRNVICHQIESSADSVHPEWTRGDRKKGGNPQSWGLCQIQYRTAVEIGGLKWLEQAGGFPAVFAALGNPERAKEVAYNILVWCTAVKKRRTVIGLAACYNAPGMSYPPTRQMLEIYAENPDWSKAQIRAYRDLRDYAEKVAAAYKETRP